MKTIRVFAAVQLLIFGAARAALDVAIVEPLEVMQSNAAAGDPSAQFNFALAYQEGNQVPKDPARALEWYRKAAAAGFVEAQYNLGVMLLNGAKAPEEEKEATRWFYAAAQNGLFDAQKILVKLYSTGRGAEKSPAKALTWDLLARRTLELRHGGTAGLPPKPGALRADGAAEMVGSAGQKEWIHPDGSRETSDPQGARHIEHKDGRKTTVETDGSWETVYPNGLTQAVNAQGRLTLTDGKGQIETTETDGSRSVEGDATDTTGKKVRVRDTFAADGKRISHRVTDGNSTLEERADGSRTVETNVTRDDGEAMILAEEVSVGGIQGKGKLRRADDGVGPKGTEIWAIQRTLFLRDGTVVEVNEKYSEAGFYSQEEVQRVVPAGTPLPKTAMKVILPPQPVMERTLLPPQTFTPPQMPMIPPALPVIATVGAGGIDDPTAFALKTDIEPMVRELEQIETTAHNFAGATEADYQRARATAAAYLVPLAISPQKAVNTPGWLRERMITQSTLHEAPLLPIPDDRSKVFPFGPHGAEIIKTGTWKHAESQHFIVHYRGEAEAKLTMQYIEGAYTVLTQLLNLDADRGAARSHVFVFPESEWKTYLQSKGHPPELAGFAYKTELLLGAATERDDRAESIKVLCHEVTHALVARFYPGCHPPLWMNEGLAEYIALRTMKSKGLSLTARPRDDKAGASRPVLIPKADAQMDVEKLFTRVRYGSRTTPDRMSAFYGNSQKCVQVLFEKLPVEGFAKFFNTLLAGNQPEVALAASFGKQCPTVAAFRQLVNGS